MKVGLLGFFNVKAYSDDLICDATQRVLLKLDPELEFDIQVMWRSVKAGKVDIDYLNSFDRLILCGGSLLGKCTFQPIIKIDEWADKLTIPLHIFGTGYRFEPEFDPLPEIMRDRMNLLFETADSIMVRGLKTVQHCEENEIDVSKISCYGEPIIAANYTTNWNLTRMVIGGNVRHMSPKEVQYTSNEQVQELMASFYDWLYEEMGYPIELISFRSLNADHDALGAINCRSKMKVAGAITRIINPTSLSQLMRYTSSVSFWFGQRMHPAVHSISRGIITIPFESQFHKMHDWLSTLRGTHHCITPYSTLKDLKEAYFDILNERYQKKLKETLQEQSYEIFDFAKEMLR